MDRPFDLPALASCVGQRYEPRPYCGMLIEPPADVRTVVGECGEAWGFDTCEVYEPVEDINGKCGTQTLGSDGECYDIPQCSMPVEVYEDP